MEALIALPVTVLAAYSFGVMARATFARPTTEWRVVLPSALASILLGRAVWPSDSSGPVVFGVHVLAVAVFTYIGVAIGIYWPRIRRWVTESPAAKSRRLAAIRPLITPPEPEELAEPSEERRAA